MNMYFHEFTPGFNWVYIIAPAMLVLVAWLGYRFGARVKMVRRVRVDHMRGQMLYGASVADERGNLYIHMVSDSFDKIIGTVAGLATCYMLLTECSLGLIQWFDNSLGPNDSTFWSLFMAMTGIIFLSSVYGVFATRIFHSFKMRKRLAVKARFGGRYHVITRKTRDFNEIVRILKETVSEEIADRKYYARAKRAGR